MSISIDPSNDLPQNILLIGFMGAGKTTTGKELARSLSFQFLDLDQMVEASTGLKIAQLFEQEGEASFRQREAGAIRDLLPKKGVVLSAGGGAWLDRTNRDLLSGWGLPVWLKVSPEAAYERVENHLSQRPLLASSQDPLRTLIDLLREREPVYSLAPIHVDTEGKSPKQVADEIRSLLPKGKR